MDHLLTDQDERFLTQSLLGLLQGPGNVQAAGLALIQLLERLFAPCQAEIWLWNPPGEPRCLNAQGNLPRFDWYRGALQRSGGGPQSISVEGWRIPLEDLGFVLVQSAQGWPPERIRSFARACQQASGPLASLLEREALQARVRALEFEQQRLQTESAWLGRCFALLQAGGELLEEERAMQKISPLIGETFVGDSLVLVTAQSSAWSYAWMSNALELSWPTSGKWPELLGTASGYQQMVHFATLEKSRFEGCLPGIRSLTLAPLAFGQGLLCRLSPQASTSQAADLRHFEIGATLLGYLLKLGSLHGQVVQSFRALQESEQQLVQAGKMAAIGQIAAGVAHEMNNPLASIRLALEMTAREKSLSGATRVSLQSAQQALDRCRDVARELLSFSRESDHQQQRQDCDIQEVVRRALGLSQELARSRGLSLRAQWHPQPLRAHLNPGQLQETLMHLLDNALWASQQQGKVVEVECRPGIEILIRDSGPGVAEELRERIFDPFFTTRPMGEATGLGLALSRKLARSMEGELVLSQTSATGSTFVLRIPEKESA